MSVRVPGRINLIGDHTDYTGGLVLPMVLDSYTVIDGTFSSDPHWTLTSNAFDDTASISFPIRNVDRLTPPWARYVASVLDEITSTIDSNADSMIRGFTGSITSDIPLGGGLSSSAALEVAVARIALGGSETHLSSIELAQLCRRAEFRATGVPCGIMDPLSIIEGRLDHATLIDCSSLEVTHIRLPDEIEIRYHFIRPRELSSSAYATRVRECNEAEAIIGPLRLADLDDVIGIGNEVLRRRARHVVTENQRVREFAESLERGDLRHAGHLMTQSHISLARDFETSIPDMDRAVQQLLEDPGVLGARMTGGGFGGCVIAMVQR